jgi:hypothetical protein
MLRPIGLVLVAIALALFMPVPASAEAAYRCADPAAEAVRKSLGVSYDLAARKRTLEMCIARQWPDALSGSKALTILGIVEKVWPSAGGEYVYRLFAARRDGDRFVLVGRSEPFHVAWPQPPKWRERITAIETGDYRGLGRSVFGIRFRADFSYKMESHWEERLVLFETDRLIEPIFGTGIRVCDCRQDSEAYPAPCFDQPTCPGPAISAELTVVRPDGGLHPTIIKRVPANGLTLQYRWQDLTSEGYYLDPFGEPAPLGVEMYRDPKYD